MIAWQIDNEFWEDCYCPNCENEFHAWLKRRYGTIENLNREWLTVLWSQDTSPSTKCRCPIHCASGHRIIHHSSSLTGVS